MSKMDFFMYLPDFKRNKVGLLSKRLQKKCPFIQVLLGPRQVGKTTAVHQILDTWEGEGMYGSADAPAPPGPDWIEQMWRAAEIKAAQGKPTLLALDEIQKVQGWAETVKALWDRQRYAPNPIHLLLCGSSSLQVHSGVSESLAGRFELIRMPHWSFSEMERCFGWDVNSYIFYGGYPGAAMLGSDWERWADYVQQSLIEAVIGKDILLMHRVQKPALLRQLYALSCDYAGQIVSYQKLLGQLQDAGNTTTLAHYQQLLDSAYLVRGLQKWHGTSIRTRSSSPKWQPYNTALVTSQSKIGPRSWQEDTIRWGRLVEIAVGAHIVNQAIEEGIQVYYWREKGKEVDFVLQKGPRIVAIEVKSGNIPKTHPGLKLFQKRCPEASSLAVGADGVNVEDFLRADLGNSLFRDKL